MMARGVAWVVLAGVVGAASCAQIFGLDKDYQLRGAGGTGGTSSTAASSSTTAGSCATTTSSSGTCQACRSACDCTCPPNPWCYATATCQKDGECVYIPGMDGTTCCYSLGTCSGGTCSLATIDPGLSCTHSCACATGTASASGCCCSTSATCDDTDTCTATGGTCL